MKDELGDRFAASLDEWKALVSLRPQLDAVVEYARLNYFKRRMAVLFTRDAYRLRDCLVMDELGAAATANGTSFLECLANGWMNLEERSVLEDMLQYWATASSGPRDGSDFDARLFRVVEEEGEVPVIARDIFMRASLENDF